jgi:hypothetical protein
MYNSNIYFVVCTKRLLHLLFTQILSQYFITMLYHDTFWSRSHTNHIRIALGPFARTGILLVAHKSHTNRIASHSNCIPVAHESHTNCILVVHELHTNCTRHSTSPPGIRPTSRRGRPTYPQGTPHEPQAVGHVFLDVCSRSLGLVLFITRYPVPVPTFSVVKNIITNPLVIRI